MVRASRKPGKKNIKNTRAFTLKPPRTCLCYKEPLYLSNLIVKNKHNIYKLMKTLSKPTRPLTNNYLVSKRTFKKTGKTKKQLGEKKKTSKKTKLGEQKHLKKKKKKRGKKKLCELLASSSLNSSCREGWSFYSGKIRGKTRDLLEKI